MKNFYNVYRQNSLSALGLKCFQYQEDLAEAPVEGDCGGQVYCAKYSVRGHIFNVTAKGCGNATDAFSERTHFIHDRFDELFIKILARVDKLE